MRRDRLDEFQGAGVLKSGLKEAESLTARIKE